MNSTGDKFFFQKRLFLKKEFINFKLTMKIVDRYPETINVVQMR